MNYIQKALEELGIANGERFRIRSLDGVFRIMRGEYDSFIYNENDVNQPQLLLGILKGEITNKNIELIPQFTEDEKAFVRICQGVKYIARDESDGLFAYQLEPIKAESEWESDETILPLYSYTPQLEFASIKWTDDKPWSREDILK